MSELMALIFVCAGLVLTVALAAVLVRKPQWLAVLAFAAMPFRLPVSIGDKSASLLIPLYLVIGAGLLAYLVRWQRSGKSLPKLGNSAPGLALLGVTVIYVLQALYSGDFTKAAENVVFFYTSFLALFFLLRRVEWTQELAVKCLVALTGLAVVFVAIGFYEFDTKQLLFNPKVISSNQFESYFRVNSIFFDPNIYGRYLVTVMIGLATVLLWAQRARTLIVVTVTLALLLAGLVLTFSQSSFVALLVGLATLAALKVSVKVAMCVSGGLVAIGLVFVIAFPSLLNLDYSSSKSVDKATSGRFELVTGGLELFKQRPIFGYGSGAFAHQYRVEKKASSERASSASHTTPVTVAAEQGILGLTAYFALLAVALVGLFRGARNDAVRAGIAAAFIALVVHTMLYAAFLEDPFAWGLLAVGTAFATKTKRVKDIP